MVTWTLSLDSGTLENIQDTMGATGLPTFEAGKTLTFTFNFFDDALAHRQVLRSFDHAGSYDTYQSISDEYRYRPQRGESPLIGLAPTAPPGETVPENLFGVWGVIESGSDVTPDTSNDPLLAAIDVFALARIEDYPDRAAARAALAATGL